MSDAIKMKIALADTLIGMLDKEMKEENYDPRNPAVKAELLKQRDALVKRLESKADTEQAQPVESDSSKPPPVTVGLKALRIDAERKSME